MRVLFWSSPFWPHIGGVEVLAIKLLPALHERGYEFIVVTSQRRPDQPEIEQYKGIAVHRFPFRGGDAATEQLMERLIRIQRRVVKLKQSFAPDLVHINSVDASNFFHLITASAHPAPLLVTLHGRWPAVNDAIVRRTLQAADWVVGCSAAILDQGRQLAPEIMARSSLIYNSVDLPSLCPDPLPMDAPRVLCLGRLSAEKGFDLAVTAFASIAARFPNARLIIAGDGPERHTLEQQVVQVNLTDRVELLGWVVPDEVPALLNTASLVLMPSRQESFGLVALEAAWMARPVVATRVGGLPEVVVHEQTGWLVEPENSQALAEAIAVLLDHPQRATQMGQAARGRAHTRFGFRRQVDAYDALYQQLNRRTRS